MNPEKLLEEYTQKVIHWEDPGLNKEDIVPEEWDKLKNILKHLLHDFKVIYDKDVVKALSSMITVEN